MEIRVVMVEPGLNGQQREVLMKTIAGNEAERYLGVNVTGVAWWGEVEEQAIQDVKRIAGCCRKAKVRRFGARMILSQVAAPKVNHYLKHAHVATDERMEDIWRPAEIAWKTATGMAVSTRGDLHKAVRGSFANDTGLEQLIIEWQRQCVQ